MIGENANQMLHVLGSIDDKNSNSPPLLVQLTTCITALGCALVGYSEETVMWELVSEACMGGGGWNAAQHCIVSCRLVHS